MAHLDNLGVAHFDLKPQNILLGDGFNYKICDFGLAQNLLEWQTATKIGGTREYAHPDVLEKICWKEIYGNMPKNRVRITPKVDLWSIGATLFKAITAQLPFDADSPEDLLSI